jgi:hypothetical protein
VPAVAVNADEPVMAVAKAYRLFARQEARGRSAAYESLAESVAGDAAVAGFVASLPPDKRQPNLLFAASRYLLGAPPGIQQLRELASQSREELAQVILLLTGLPALAAQAPPGATLVIYHCSVLYQVPSRQREQFAATVSRLGARWLSSEAPGIVPGTAARALDDQMCVLARDGHAIATADSHGTWLQWLP